MYLSCNHMCIYIYTLLYDPQYIYEISNQYVGIVSMFIFVHLFVICILYLSRIQAMSVLPSFGWPLMSPARSLGRRCPAWSERHPGSKISGCFYDDETMSMTMIMIIYSHMIYYIYMSCFIILWSYYINTQWVYMKQWLCMIIYLYIETMYNMYNSV